MKLAIPIPAPCSLQNPAWSPDGTQLSFTVWHNHYNGAPADVFTVELSTMRVFKVPLKPGSNVSQPGACWGPKGIIFSTNEWGEDAAGYYDPATGGLHQLFFGAPDQAWEPSWGQDFYVAERHRAHAMEKGQIIMGPLIGNHLTWLTVARRDCRQPNVSPDGTEIVFQDMSDGPSLRLMEINTKAESKLCTGTDATFAPDGHRLVYSDNDGKLRVYNLMSRRSAPVVGVDTPYAGAPSWSPDGKTIAYEGGPSGDDGGPPTSIYVVDAPEVIPSIMDIYSDVAD